MPAQWEIPRKVWAVLFSWGLAVLMLAGLFSFWMWHAQREKDRAMCQLTDLIIAGPAPVPGAAGDRGRSVLAGMHKYQGKLHCAELR